MPDPRFTSALMSDPRFAHHLTRAAAGTDTGRGVVYFSSVPTNMRPTEVQLHFQQFGKVTRKRFIAHQIKHNVSGKRTNTLQFKEGWMEFAKREDAQRAARMMNGAAVACKRFRKARGQWWNVKYLEDFSWDRLREDQEEEIRERKTREFREKESERSANEAFRAAILAKKKYQEKKRLEHQAAGENKAAAPTTEAADAGNLTTSASEGSQSNHSAQRRAKSTAGDLAADDSSAKKKKVARKSDAPLPVVQKKKVASGGDKSSIKKRKVPSA